jgi:hypothetical protein
MMRRPYSGPVVLGSCWLHAAALWLALFPDTGLATQLRPSLSGKPGIGSPNLEVEALLHLTDFRSVNPRPLLR